MNIRNAVSTRNNHTIKREGELISLMLPFPFIFLNLIFLYFLTPDVDESDHVQPLPLLIVVVFLVLPFGNRVCVNLTEPLRVDCDSVVPLLLIVCVYLVLPTVCDFLWRQLPITSSQEIVSTRYVLGQRSESHHRRLGWYS